MRAQRDCAIMSISRKGPGNIQESIMINGNDSWSPSLEGEVCFHILVSPCVPRDLSMTSNFVNVNNYTQVRFLGRKRTPKAQLATEVHSVPRGRASVYHETFGAHQGRVSSCIIQGSVASSLPILLSNRVSVEELPNVTPRDTYRQREDPEMYFNTILLEIPVFQYLNTNVKHVTLYEINHKLQNVPSI